MDEIILNSGKKTVTCFAKAFDQVGNFNYTILVSTTPTLYLLSYWLKHSLFFYWNHFVQSIMFFIVHYFEIYFYLGFLFNSHTAIY